MKNRARVNASKQPDGDGYQVTYESGGSRKLHHLPAFDQAGEPTPHAAGSFHDPKYHQILMDRIDKYLSEESKSG